jgi:hypothetical protein
MQPPSSYSAVLHTLSYSKHMLVFIINYNGIMNIFFIQFIAWRTDRYVSPVSHMIQNKVCNIWM